MGGWDSAREARPGEGLDRGRDMLCPLGCELEEGHESLAEPRGRVVWGDVSRR